MVFIVTYRYKGWTTPKRVAIHGETMFDASFAFTDGGKNGREIITIKRKTKAREARVGDGFQFNNTKLRESLRRKKAGDWD